MLGLLLALVSVPVCVVATLFLASVFGPIMGWYMVFVWVAALSIGWQNWREDRRRAARR